MTVTCPPQCSFMEYMNYKIVYRKYASLYFIIAVDNTEVRWVCLLEQ